MKTWVCNIKNNSDIKRIIHIYKDMDYDLETKKNVSGTKSENVGTNVKKSAKGPKECHHLFNN